MGVPLGSCGFEPIIEVIVKLEKQSRVRGGGGGGGGRVGWK